MVKKNLTNERLKIKFKSNFDLTNFAIKMGREQILGGKFSTLDDFISDLKKVPTSVIEHEEEEEEEEEDIEE